MNTVNTHYPNYDVMAMVDEWDSHTKEIVKKRLGPFKEPEYLSEKEANYISIIAKHIIYDNRENIINWIVHSFDQKLKENIGEAQRKPNTPPEKRLIREGLQALDHVAKLSYSKEFGELKTEQQFDILSSLDKGKAPIIPDWSKIPQKELFNKLVGLITSAYYSHPEIWSEIGYGGPMYPRIYTRVEFGLTDPWEARMDGK